MQRSSPVETAGAADSPGMSPQRRFEQFVLPQVLIEAAPMLGNPFTSVVKSSSLVSLIPDVDLMFGSQKDE